MPILDILSILAVQVTHAQVAILARVPSMWMKCFSGQQPVARNMVLNPTSTAHDIMTTHHKLRSRLAAAEEMASLPDHRAVPVSCLQLTIIHQQQLLTPQTSLRLGHCGMSREAKDMCIQLMFLRLL
jgi:hypothetical protein